MTKIIEEIRKIILNKRIKNTYDKSGLLLNKTLNKIISEIDNKKFIQSDTEKHELIDALIDSCKNEEEYIKDMGFNAKNNTPLQDKIKLIEKHTGKSWEEIDVK